MKEIKGAEVQEIKSTGIENFQNIKPESNITREQANSFWDKFRHSKEVENNNYETGIPNEFYSTIEERQEQLLKIIVESSGSALIVNVTSFLISGVNS